MLVYGHQIAQNVSPKSGIADAKQFLRDVHPVEKAGIKAFMKLTLGVLVKYSSLIL
jgi:hypothetical protein